MSHPNGTRVAFPLTTLALALLAGACSQAPAPMPAAPAPAAPATNAAAVTSPAASMEKVTTVEGITEYRLPNGLRVLLFPDASKPQTTVNVTYMVGSRHEGYGETGMAHLLEHMLFKGTPDHTNIPQELTERGARPNGTTWYDRTNYFETFPANEDNLRWALDLESDRMVHSNVAKKDLDSEMTVVRNEFEMGENSPFSVLMERVMSTMYLWHHYGQSTIGARSDIENVPIERLQAFYHKYYQPDNAMLVVAGKFDEATAKRLIENTFGAIPRPERTGGDILYPTYTEEPTQDGERVVNLQRVGDVQVVMAAYHVPPGSHSDYAAVDVLSEILGDEPAGRLYKNLVETQKASSAGSLAFQLKEAGPLLTYAEVRQDKSLDAARQALLGTIDELLGPKPVTQEEVDRAKATLLKNIELTFNSSERIALQLSEWESMGDWRLFFLHRDRIEKVRPEDVQRVAETYLKSSNRTLGLFTPTPAPDRADVPEEPDVQALVANYTGRADVATGEEFDPSPANVEARTQKLTFDDGFELALLPKDTRGETVVATISLRYGNESALMNCGRAGDLAGEMLMRGTTQHTRQQIKDEFDRLKARVNVNGSPTSAFASIETTRDNLPAVLRLVAEVLRQPAFSADEWKLMKEERLAALEEQKSDPQAQAFNAFSRIMSDLPKGHPLYTETIEEEIASVSAAKLEDAKRFYHDFYGANAGTMAIVGDFDPDAVTPILREAFGDWTSATPYARIERDFHPVAAVDSVIETPDKANAWFVAAEPLRLSDTSDAYPALMLGNYMLGGGFLNSRLATRIRQKEGLSYGVGSFIGADPLDERGQFVTYAIYAPENVDKLETAFREEIQKALLDGFAPDEVDAAREGLLQSRQMTRAQDMALASQLSSNLYLDRTLMWDASLEEKIGGLTPDQIATALRQYIDPAGITVIKAGDFSKEEKPTS